MPTIGFANETGQGGEYRYIDPVWKGGVAVSPGDLVYRDTGDGYDKPMSSHTWTTNIATTSAAANAVFRGVSTARRVTTQTTDGGKTDGPIIYTGEFCFPCTALTTAAKPGDLVSFEANAGATAMENQKVRITTVAAEAIGRVTRDAPVGQAFIYFTVQPGLMFGGPTAAA